MKSVVIGLLVTGFISSVCLAEDSLDQRAAKECKQFAIAHALKVEKKVWGDEVRLLHLDRSLPMGVTNGKNGEEIDGDVNVEVTLSRESADPVIHEMRLIASPMKNSNRLKCRIAKEVRREIL